jgi:hypothetical protein
LPEKDPVQKYFDSLVATYDILVDAVEKANERGLKVAQQLAADVVKGQRDAIELGRTFATQPGDIAGFYSALLGSTTEAQGRVLAFTQNAYQEAVAAGADARETVQKVVEANRETGRLAMEAFRSYAGTNPFAEAMTRAAEAFAPTTSTATASAASRAREKTAAAAS